MTAADPLRALDAALTFAAAGWPVFPCLPGHKEPATAHGFHDASTDPDLLRWRWARTPAANVAVATGWPGPDVLDVDVTPAGSGLPALERLRRAGLLGGALGIVATPRGGLHLYYVGSELGNRTKIGGQPLDFRGRGGYVLVPPSVVVGAPYRVLEWRGAGGRLDLAAVERVLIPSRRPRPRRPGRGSGGVAALSRWVAGQGEGNRNAGLFWAACRAIEQGADDAQLDALSDAALGAGLPACEVARTIDSALRRVEVAQ